MAITLFPVVAGESITPEEFMTYVAENVDPYDDDSIIGAATMLAKLNNNRDFLTDFFHRYLEGAQSGRTGGFYSLQSALLGQTRDGMFKLRANFWMPPRTSGAAKKEEEALLAYHLPHDHNFPFLTIGYAGVGYQTDIYEYDRNKIEGRPGEITDLRFLERTRLSQGKVIYFRPSKDVHSQIAPESFSISLNLLVHRQENPLIGQFIFDPASKAIVDHVDSVDNLRVDYIGVAAAFNDARSRTLLHAIAAGHRCRRTRDAAARTLHRIDTGEGRA